MFYLVDRRVNIFGTEVVASFVLAQVGRISMSSFPSRAKLIKRTMKNYRHTDGTFIVAGRKAHRRTDFFMTSDHFRSFVWSPAYLVCLTLSLPWVPIGPLINFTLSNARRFYSSMGNPLGVKGLLFVCRTKKVLFCSVDESKSFGAVSKMPFWQSKIIYH